MIEEFAEYLALFLYTILFIVALVRGFKTRTKVWIILAFGYGCNLFAQAYWVAYMLVFGVTPQYFYIADIGWAAMYLFIIMLLVEGNIAREPEPPQSAAWAPVVVSAFLCVYYIYVGSNVVACLVDNGLVASIGFFAMKGLMAKPKEGFATEGETAGLPLRYNRVFSGMCLALVIAELGLWTASCFSSYSIHPYIVFDYIVFAANTGLLVSAWGSEEA